LSIRGGYPYGNYWNTRVLSCAGNLYFKTRTNYVTHTDSLIKAYANSGGAISWSATGGTLHGTWDDWGGLSTSDRSLKENIQPLEDTLQEGHSPDILRELRPVSYRYKGSSEESQRTRFGFIADEMAQTLPQITRTLPDRDENEGMQGLVYADLLAFLTSMLQSMAKDMAVLVPRLTSIEDRIAERKRWKQARRNSRAAASVATPPSGVERSFVV
jgi:hypothetical protein